MLTFICSSGI